MFFEKVDQKWSTFFVNICLAGPPCQGSCLYNIYIIILVIYNINIYILYSYANLLCCL